MPLQPLFLRPIGFHVLGSLVLCAAVGAAVLLMANASQRWVAHTQRALADTTLQLQADRLASLEGVSDVRLAATWPERASVDALTQAMSEQAIVNGLVLRTLSLSHGAPSERAWGRVSLEVAASGRYADLKNWQGGLLARFPSLAVQSLRLQPVAGGPVSMGGVEAHMVWALYVRD
jgi:hypothetical protein